VSLCFAPRRSLSPYAETKLAEAGEPVAG
jgi:hypothetical protein